MILDQYPLLVTLSLFTLGVVLVLAIVQFFGVKRSQKHGHRAEAARVRGARDKHDRPGYEPDRVNDGARHPGHG